MALASRPGVWETLSDRVSATADSKSFKGGTMQYRLELWKVAWAQVTKSMQTFFFGYGPGCGSETEIDWTLSYRGQEYGISSWDNQFAYDLFQSGFLGLIASLILYGSALLFLYRAWVTADPANRDLVLTLFASALALVFMMTNVLIFAKQLYYLFWTLVATAPFLARKTTLQPQFDAEMESELDDASPAQRLA
jgi:Lipid A core - O-antigen ligase and related enzymes